VACDRPRAETTPGVDQIMADPSVSRFLKLTLDAWLFRDPLDAAKDAELLAAVLGRRADVLLGRAT
jgi:hypothetical protein